MVGFFEKSRRVVVAAGFAAGLLAAGGAGAAQVQVKLSGSQEVPAVTTKATGTGVITVGSDKAVSGSVTTSGIEGTMAHIHEAAAGKNGPVIIPLEKKSADKWVVPEGAKFTDEQYKAYQAGDLYYNVHSAAHKAGEIRGQIKP
jgi:hypothetical protein